MKELRQHNDKVILLQDDDITESTKTHFALDWYKIQL